MVGGVSLPLWASELPLLCIVTHSPDLGGRELGWVVAELVRGGARLVQVREKQLGAGALLDLTRELSHLTRRRGAALVVNDRLDVALAAGADGVHLPAAGLPPAAVRQLAGAPLLVGASVHDAAAAAAAVAAGVDYLIFGHIFATASKSGLAPRGLAALEQVVAAASGTPVLGIGGITPANAGLVRAAGAAGVAVMSSAMAAPGPAAYAAALIAALKEGG